MRDAYISNTYYFVLMVLKNTRLLLIYDFELVVSYNQTSDIPSNQVFPLMLMIASGCMSGARRHQSLALAQQDHHLDHHHHGGHHQDPHSQLNQLHVVRSYRLHKRSALPWGFGSYRRRFGQFGNFGYAGYGHHHHHHHEHCHYFEDGHHHCY